jgi:hypothetical protein
MMSSERNHRALDQGSAERHAYEVPDAQDWS